MQSVGFFRALSAPPALQKMTFSSVKAGGFSVKFTDPEEQKQFLKAITFSDAQMRLMLERSAQKEQNRLTREWKADSAEYMFGSGIPSPTVDSSHYTLGHPNCVEAVGIPYLGSIKNQTFRFQKIGTHTLDTKTKRVIRTQINTCAADFPYRFKTDWFQNMKTAKDYFHPHYSIDYNPKTFTMSFTPPQEKEVEYPWSQNPTTQQEIAKTHLFDLKPSIFQNFRSNDSARPKAHPNFPFYDAQREKILALQEQGFFPIHRLAKQVRETFPDISGKAAFNQVSDMYEQQQAFNRLIQPFIDEGANGERWKIAQRRGLDKTSRNKK